jgi:hypothetical protein
MRAALENPSKMGMLILKPTKELPKPQNPKTPKPLMLVPV